MRTSAPIVFEQYGQVAVGSNGVATALALR